MNDRLNSAIERLLLDKRFLSRFRRDPERALKLFGLSRKEIAAVKRGNADELVALGLDPGYVSPAAPDGFLPAFMVRHPKHLMPSLLAAASLSSPRHGRTIGLS